MLCPEGAKAQRTMSVEEVALRDTNLPIGSVSTLMTPSRPECSRTSNPFVSIP